MKSVTKYSQKIVIEKTTTNFEITRILGSHSENQVTSSTLLIKGSIIPASENPFRRKWQAGQVPHGGKVPL